MEDGEYFLESSRYHLNPPQRPAQLWPWSSHRAYTGDSCVVDWVATDRTLSFFSDRKDYQSFVESKSSEKLISPLRRATAGLILGGQSFVESVKSRLRQSSHLEAKRVLRALARSHPGLDFDQVKAAVERVFGDASPCRRRRLHAYALRNLTHARISDVAAATGLSPSAVSHAARSLEERLRQRPSLRKRMLLLRDLLS